MRAIEAIEQVDWTRYIEDLKEYIEYTEARLDRLRVSPIAETSSPKHRAALLESLRDVVTKTREQIKDRQANVRAKAIGPCPDLGELFGIYDTHDEAFDVLYAWFDAVWELPKPQREAMLGQAEDHLTCGSAPSEQTEWDPMPYPASFAEQRWEWFKHNPEGFRANYGEKIYQDYVVMASEAEEEITDKKPQKCKFCGRSMNAESLESHQSQAHPHEWEVRRDDDPYISIQDMEETWGTWDESVKEMDRRHAEEE